MSHITLPSALLGKGHVFTASKLALVLIWVVVTHRELLLQHPSSFSGNLVRSVPQLFDSCALTKVLSARREEIKYEVDGSLSCFIIFSVGRNRDVSFFVV